MTTAKDKGNRWERPLRRAFNAFGIKAFKPAQEGHDDAGDIQGLSPFVGQAKNWRSWEAAMREGLDGAERQKVVAGEPYGVAFVKRARRATGDGYAVMTVATFARVLKRLHLAENLLFENAEEDAWALYERENARNLATPFPRGTEAPE